MEVSLWDLIQSGNLDQDIPLRDGDRVMIFAAARSPEEDARIAAANFSPQDPRLMRVAVAGEIRRPGTYSKEVEPGEIGPTLTEIIRESGGITEQADVRRVQVIRPTPTGEPMVLESNLWDLIQSGDLGQDIRLRDGDRVIVSMATTSPEESLRIATSNFSPDNILVQVAGEVPRGGNIELPVNASLNQAILAAGGLDNPRARSSAVELVRLNRDGTVLRQTYAVDLAAPPNEETNPILRADDVVIVRRNVISRTTDWLNVLVAPFVGLSTFFRLFGL
jgi:polysaccharide export outer membrane protein